MNYDKPFKTLDEQLHVLKNRGLLVPNDNQAKHIIMTSSYYDLINGYKNIFMPNDTFKQNIIIEHLFAFLFIDKSLQAIIVKYALMLEVKFKNHLAYVISKNLGVHVDDYLHSQHYKAQASKGLTFTQVKKEINTHLDINKAKQPTKHYITHHNHVPPWILLKNVSLGTSINFFKCFSSANKNKVSELLLPSTNIPTKDKVELILTVMEGVRVFRNCAAHSLNFINCRTHTNIPAETLYKLVPSGVIKRNRSKITAEDKTYLRGIFGIIISMIVLLDDNLLNTMLISEINSTIINSNKGLDNLYHDYISISDMPIDIDIRLNSFSTLYNLK